MADAQPFRKKLIEVALPLEAINRESAREKSIRHGHPSTLHLWWARRPLATCRAVLFASLVDDPSSHPDTFPTEEAQDKERQRLFRIIEELVKWDNANNEQVLSAARAEIMKATNGNPPPVLDPFCGGGSIPLEAQRLGLEAHASDLNPVAVLITKALIEIPPKFAGKPPVNPDARKKIGHGQGCRGAQGLAEDVRYYGQWMRDEAEKRIGHLYPKVKLPKEYGGGEATVIAWLWARTVKCPNPACGARMPLVRTFWLSTKAGKNAWVTPIIEERSRTVRFEVRTGTGPVRDKTVGRRGALCIICNLPVSLDHIRLEGRAGRMGTQLMAVVADGPRGRLYLSPDEQHDRVARSANADDVPDTDLPDQALGFRVQNYGITKHRDLFTPRQLVALATFSDLVREARQTIQKDALDAGMAEDSLCLKDGGLGATAYGEAVAVYLGLLVDKLATANVTLAVWRTGHGTGALAQAFSAQSVPMTWDYPEANVFGGAAGDPSNSIDTIARVLDNSPISGPSSYAAQSDVARLALESAFVCTDPPYYDNIGYADLSDFFYVWLRRSVRESFPSLFETVLTPKAEELIASPFRAGGDRKTAQVFFEQRLLQAFSIIRRCQSESFPLIIYYAFKQAETDEDDAERSGGVASTGWETMLGSLLASGFGVTGTWPVKTERPSGVKVDVNALASSIVLVCRPRRADAALSTRRDFLSALKHELPTALRLLQRGNIAPVDLAQAAIGPGMAVFSRYSRVLEADGSPMTIRTALGLINQTLDEVLAEQEGEFDSDTRWAITWFEQHAMEDGPFGEANVLAQARNTAVNGLVEAGIVAARAGKVRLLKREEMNPDWDPTTDKRLTVWEVTQHLIHALEKDGETGAAALLRKIGALGEVARDLAYRLYGICERKKWAQEALAYNSLVIAWSEMLKLASASQEAPSQRTLL